jgi:hypothetical protein
MTLQENKIYLNEVKLNGWNGREMGGDGWIGGG